MVYSDNYKKYRGHCRETAEKLSKERGYKLVKGFYNEPIWNIKEQHWWCVDNNGKIYDPSAKQFPSGGIEGFYEEYTGFVNCEHCGKKIAEEHIIMQGRFPVCSEKCALFLVGLGDYYQDKLKYKIEKEN